MRWRNRLVIVVLCSALLPWGAVSAQASRPGGLPQGVNPGRIEVLRQGPEKPVKPLELPLTHTDVAIVVNGFTARATVVQHFSNPFATPIEARYVFPLPDRAAVDGMNMRIGDRLVLGEVKQREEARRIYQQAKSQGKRAGLLEQERPNVFTQSVGNIMPGDEIRVEISYVDMLAFRDAGEFELVFPMVVGPRYIPGAPAGKQAGGWSTDTDRVPDASRITPPVLEPGARSGHDIALTIELDAAVPLQGVHSVSHAVDIEELSASRRRIRLHPSDTLPNKDFILRYAVAGDAPQAAVIAEHESERGGFFTLIALPPKEVGDTLTVPRDLVFVLDTSGSMRGQPLEQSRRAMQRLLDGMRPEDRFNVVRFAGDTGTLWPQPRPGTPENRRAAKAYVDSLRGSGGTEMRAGITEALSQASDAERLRIAILLTDGYVGNEQAIFQSIEQEARGARVFTFGVGSSVNRYLLDRAAAVGRGEAFYLRQDENAEPVIQRFFRRVDRPSLAHIQIDWNGLSVSDLSPARIPDLWQGQPLKLHGRYRKGGRGQIRISGRLGGRSHSWTVPVELPEQEPGSGLMAAVWARSRVAELLLQQSRNRLDEDVESRVTELGLNFRILTPWTSFVAVEEKVVNQGGEQKTVMQPVELPEGVDYQGVFGAAGEAEPAPVAAMAAPTRSAMAPGIQHYLAARPRVAKDVAQESREAADDSRAEQPAPPKNCRYDALRVSGGLRYPAVERALRAAWSQLCRDLGALPAKPVRLQLELTLDADGSVFRVHTEEAGLLTPEFLARLRKAFEILSFGPVAGPGKARVGLALMVGF
jgi:Ca-activated chloride channel family protein